MHHVASLIVVVAMLGHSNGDPQSERPPVAAEGPRASASTLSVSKSPGGAADHPSSDANCVELECADGAMVPDFVVYARRGWARTDSGGPLIAVWGDIAWALGRQGSSACFDLSDASLDAAFAAVVDDIGHVEGFVHYHATYQSAGYCAQDCLDECRRECGIELGPRYAELMDAIRALPEVPCEVPSCTDAEASPVVCPGNG